MMVHVVVFHLLLEYLQLSNARHSHLVLVCDQRSIKVNGESQEDDQHRNQYNARWPGSLLAQVVELHPAQNGDLEQKQNKSEKGGECPCRFDVPVKTFVWWFMDKWDAVEIADGFDVGQDAGTDHKGQHVDSDEKSRADGEGDKHTGGNLSIIV